MFIVKKDFGDNKPFSFVTKSLRVKKRNALLLGVAVEGLSVKMSLERQPVAPLLL